MGKSKKKHYEWMDWDSLEEEDCWCDEQDKNHYKERKAKIHKTKNGIGEVGKLFRR